MMYSFYEKDTGKFIHYKVDCPLQHIRLNCPENCYGIEGDYDPYLYYVVDHIPTLRPESPAVLSNMSISSVPIPSKLHINDMVYDVTESSVELDFSYPGKYSLRLESFPFLDKIFEVTK